MYYYGQISLLYAVHFEMWNVHAKFFVSHEHAHTHRVFHMNMHTYTE